MEKVNALAIKFNCTLSEEPYLIPLVMEIANTPLPPDWKWIESTQMFMQESTGMEQEQHPAYAYFMKRVQQTRDEKIDGQVYSSIAGFTNSDGKKMYFDFRTNTVLEHLPKDEFTIGAEKNEVDLSSGANRYRFEINFEVLNMVVMCCAFTRGGMKYRMEVR